MSSAPPPESLSGFLCKPVEPNVPASGEGVDLFVIGLQVTVVPFSPHGFLVSACVMLPMMSDLDPLFGTIDSHSCSLPLLSFPVPTSRPWLPVHSSMCMCMSVYV